MLKNSKNAVNIFFPTMLIGIILSKITIIQI